MKTGDYVRTKKGTIYQFNSTSSKALSGAKKYMVKSSPNIIDLIEEHDILKIEEQKGVYTICEVELFKEPYTNHQFLGVRIDNQPMARSLCELNIKSIVTKEQFESMEYKVGE